MTYIITSTGRKVYELSPDDSEGVCTIEEIGDALSKLCRFRGHCREFYSVAQHSYLVSRLAMELARERGQSIAEQLKAGIGGLLHDAHEAYLGDYAKPTKARHYVLSLEKTDPISIDDLDRGWNRRIAADLDINVDWLDLKVVTQADADVFDAEWRDLMASDSSVESKHPTIVPACPDDANLLFINQFARLVLELERAGGAEANS